MHLMLAHSFPDLNAVTFFGNSDNVLETGVSGGDAGTSFTRDSVIVIDDNVALSSEGNPISVFALTISNERLLGGELRGSSFLGIIETYVNADGNVSVGINSNDPGNPINLIGNIPLEVAGDAGEGVRVFFEGSDPTIVDSGNLAVRLELVRIIPEPTTAGFLGIGVLAILRRRRAAR